MSAPEEDDFLLDGSDAEQDDFVLEDAPAPAPSAAEKKSSQKSKLAELANRKRREQEEAAEEQRAKSAAKRLKRAELEEGEAEEPAAAAAPAEEPRADDRDDEGDLAVTAADRNFIDDTGVADEDRIDFGDDEEAIDAAEEAAEDMDDELDRLFSKGRRQRDAGDGAESRAMVENLLAAMEVAVEEDMRDYEAGKPAVHKLRMLRRVEDALSTKRIHNELLDAGLLGVLKAWIEPMPDGTLPNARVRGAVLRLLGGLPVDCAYEDRREQLKRSGLGRVVMFLFKLPDETAANRRMAKELVDKWSRPLLARRAHTLDEGEAERILAARKARSARAELSEAATRDAAEAASERPLRPGDPGFRWHAAIPQAATLDYVRAPEAKYAMPDKKGASSKAAEHKLVKKLKGTSGGGNAPRAATLSVEGRNVNFRQ